MSDDTKGLWLTLNKLLEKNALFVFVAGAVLVLIGAGALQKFDMQITDNIMRTTIVVIGIMVLGCGIYLIMRDQKIRDGTEVVKSKYNLHIISQHFVSAPQLDQNKQKFNAQVQITGTSSSNPISDGYEVLVIHCHAGSDKHWILRSYAKFSRSGGDWQLDFGLAGSGKMRVVLYLVRETGKALLRFHRDVAHYRHEYAPDGPPLPVRGELGTDFIPCDETLVELPQI